MKSNVSSRFSALLTAIGVLRILVPLLGVAALVGLIVGLPGMSPGLMVSAGAATVMAVVVIEIVFAAVGVLLKIESTTYRNHDLELDVRDATIKQARLLETVSQHSQLSDMAKGIAFREQERDLIRRAINETLIGGDFEAAYFLADQLERRHGYRQEAEKLRKEIDAARTDSARHQISEGIERIEQMLTARQWEAARREIERYQAATPYDPAVQKLPELLRQRRAEHKRWLLKEWDQSVQRNEIDRGIEILRELDQYLTPNEAAALEESARGVFRAKLHNMGVQFSIAVTDRQWVTALDIGQQIINEFPNSRMAAEVREHLDALRTRAARSVEAVA